MPHLPHAFRIFWLGEAASLLGTATRDAAPDACGDGAIGTARASIALQLASCGCLLVLLAAPGGGVAWLAAGVRTALGVMVGSYVAGAPTIPFGPLKCLPDLPAPPPRRSRPLERSIPA